MLNTKHLIYLLLTATAAALVFCTRELPEAVKPGTYLNLAEDVDYVGMNTCKSCHADVHETYIHTGMGRSFGRATLEKTDAEFGDHALVYEATSDLYYKPFFRDSQMYVLEFRLQDGDTVHQRLEKIDYIVGSGQHTNSHIININGYVYQAPITYYTQEGKWDMAPGFEGDNIRFSRLLAAECITCHNDLPKQFPGSMNKYEQMPEGIACERCHGPGELHVKARLSGQQMPEAGAADYTIVNPSRLPRDLQMDLCQRCHLQGIAVLKEGKDFYDFKPGMRLNEVVNIFLPRYTNDHERFIMASQADRLRLSPCYINTEMTCLTCHNPHQSIAVTDKEQYNTACINCHGGQREEACTAEPAVRLAAGDDCSGCHMPRSGSIDIPHVNITDHFISRGQAGRAQATASKGTPGFLGLEILTKDKGSPLEMAEGYLAMYEKYTQSPMLLDSVRLLLSRSRADARSKLPLLIHYHFLAEGYPAIRALAEGYQASDIADGWTAYRIGEAYYQAQAYERALSYYERAVHFLPLHLDFQEKMGTVLLQLRQAEAAEVVLQRVLAEHPKRTNALSNLGFALILQGRAEEAEHYYDAAIALDPDYEQALLNKAAARLMAGDQRKALELARRVLLINPANTQARALLQQF